MKEKDSAPLNVVLEAFFGEIGLPDDRKLAPDLQTFASPGFPEFSEKPGDEAVAEHQPSVLEGVREAEPVLNLVQPRFPALQVELAAASLPGKKIFHRNKLSHFRN